MLKEMYSNVLDVAATSSDHISIDLTHDQIKQMRNKHISHNHDQSHAKPQNPEEVRNVCLLIIKSYREFLSISNVNIHL